MADPDFVDCCLCAAARLSLDAPLVKGDEATAAAQGLAGPGSHVHRTVHRHLDSMADLATRQPRASLSLTGAFFVPWPVPALLLSLHSLRGAAATSLAADADRLQSLSDELGAAKAWSAWPLPARFRFTDQLWGVWRRKARKQSLSPWT